MAVISKGIGMSYIKSGSSGTPYELENLIEIPDLGGEAEAIDVTTLADEARVYTNGILNYGDSLPFKFLYVKEQFNNLCELAEEVEWTIYLPDGANCTFNGACSVKLDGVGVNAALTYTLSIKPTSAFNWA